MVGNTNAKSASSTDSVSIGNSAQNSVSTGGSRNVAVGSNTLQNNVSGQDNVAIGYYALNNHASASGVSVAVGANALRNSSVEYDNVAVGYNAGYYTSGSTNVFVGNNAGTGNVLTNNYSYNVGVGASSLQSITLGNYNVAIGYGAGGNINTGTRNTLIGQSTGDGITTGNYNTLVGYNISLSSSLSNTIILADGSGNKRFYANSSGYVGINTTNPQTSLSVNAKVTDDNTYTHDTDALYVVHQTATSTTTLNDPKEILLLARQGTGGQAYGAAASFRLSRYENSSVNSRTRLDLILAHDSFLASPTTVMTLRSSGDVGIGTTTPSSKLEVNGVVKDQYGDLRTLPENAKTAAYTLAASDTGRLITTTSTQNITVNSGVFSIGQVVTIYNNSSGSLTIAQGASVTLRLAGTTTTGSRTLAQYGLASVMCVASNVFIVSGSGVT